MTQPINLNKARKAKARVTAKSQADVNAVKFGQSKGARNLQTARSEKSARALSQHMRDEDV